MLCRISEDYEDEVLPPCPVPDTGPNAEPLPTLAKEPAGTARQDGHSATANQHKHLCSGLKRFLEIFQAALFTTPRKAFYLCPES